MADMMYGSSMMSQPSAIGIGGGELSEENNTEYFGGINNNPTRPRFPGLYIGNLTWWTTDQDVINSINSVGVTDVQEVKFFENRNNGQSKGFCVVTFTSEASLPIVMEKLPKLELYGQNPVVTPYNRQSLNLFESQTKQIRPAVNNNGPTPTHAAGIMGISSISGVHANTQGLPYSAGGMNNYNPGMATGGLGPGAGVVGGIGGHLGGGGMGIPRATGPYVPGMRMPGMRPMRPFMGRAGIPNAMGNGPMIPGGGGPQRMPRFMQQQQSWNNSSGYNSGGRPIAQNDMDSGMIPRKLDDISGGQDLHGEGGGTRGYFPGSHYSSSSDHHYRDLRDRREHLRPDDRDRERERERERIRERERDHDRDIRRLDDRIMRVDENLRATTRHTDDRPPPRSDDRSRLDDDRGSSSRRLDDRSISRRDDDGRSSSRRDEKSSSSRREKDSVSGSSSSRRERSHRDRSRSREKSSRDRSRERKRERR